MDDLTTHLAGPWSCRGSLEWHACALRMMVMSQNDHDTNPVPDADPMPLLYLAHRDHPDDSDLIGRHVRACLAAGYTWDDVGPALGLTINAAREQWGQ